MNCIDVCIKQHVDVCVYDCVGCVVVCVVVWGCEDTIRCAIGVSHERNIEA